MSILGVLLPRMRNFNISGIYMLSSCTMGTKLLSWLGVGPVISRSLVQFPTGALWSVLGQHSLFHIASVYPAAKWVPRMNKAVLRACALYAVSCSVISPGGLKWLPCEKAC